MGQLLLAGIFGIEVLVYSVVQPQLGRLKASLGNKTYCLGILCFPDGMVDIEQAGPGGLPLFSLRIFVYSRLQSNIM